MSGDLLVSQLRQPKGRWLQSACTSTYTILCYTILYYTILYYTILYYTAERRLHTWSFGLPGKSWSDFRSCSRCQFDFCTKIAWGSMSAGFLSYWEMFAPRISSALTRIPQKPWRLAVSPAKNRIGKSESQSDAVIWWCGITSYAVLCEVIVYIYIYKHIKWYIIQDHSMSYCITSSSYNGEFPIKASPRSDILPEIW